MRLFKIGKLKTVWNSNFTREYYSVKYVSDPEDDKHRSDYVYTLLYEVKEYHDKVNTIPEFIVIKKVLFK